MKKKKTIKKTSESSLLSQIGLSQNEAQIYEIMLTLGKVPASKIFANLSQKRTTVYAVLEKLIKKGLVEKDDSQPVTKFRAKHPYALKEMIDAQVQSIKTAENKLDAVLPDFISLYNTSQNRPGIKFYEGKEGIKKVLHDSLTSQTEILTYVDIETVMKFIPDINKKYATKREKLGIKKRGIIIDTPAARKYLSGYHTAVTDSKLIPAIDKNTKTIMQIYDNKISYLTLDEQAMIGLIIEDKNIYRMHKNMFEYAWELAPKYQPNA